ncbi:reverse transcriptase domain-containing protein [Tanacetum coccineum]
MDVLTKREIADKFSEEHLMALKSKFNNDEPWYADFVNYIVGKVVPPNWTFKKRKRFFSQVNTYFWDEPYAFKLCVDNIIRRCVAGSETLKILAHCHSGPTGGHHSASVTAKKVYESRFYWPSIFKDDNEYEKSLMYGDWILWDHFPNLEFLRSLFARFGVPKALISDRGTYFCNSQLEKALQRYGVTHKLSTAYHPQSNRQTEVTNRAIKHILERSVGYNPKGWSEKLNDALWAFRTAYKAPTRCTPFRLVYGKACHLPVKIEHKPHWALKQCNMDLTLASESRLMQLNELAELRDGAYENTRIYKERTKKWHDSKLHGDKDFKEGDKVLLYNSRLKMYPGKLKSKWSGLNVVKTVYPHGAIEITDSDRVSFKVNGQRLKKYYGGNIDKENDEVIEFKNGATLSIRRIQTPWIRRISLQDIIQSLLSAQSIRLLFFYGKIEEEVYVCQPPGFEDPDFLDRVYKVEKALYGLHQAPRAWYETLSTYLLDNGFQRGKIDKTLFIKRHKGDILQMSSMGELTFFLGLQVKQKKDGIFIGQDKYVAEILKKFRFTEVKTASTPMETQKPLLKDEDGEEVDVHMYRLMIGSLMYFKTLHHVCSVCLC